MIRRPPRSTLFPTRRSSDLGLIAPLLILSGAAAAAPATSNVVQTTTQFTPKMLQCDSPDPARAIGGCEDRKSTRLNSSHANISYAVFSFKKKNNLPAPSDRS